MSPEVVQFQEYDDRADVWSLGVISYICLMGQLPFCGTTNKEIYNQILLSQPAMTQLETMWQNGACIDFIQKCLSKDQK